MSSAPFSPTFSPRTPPKAMSDTSSKAVAKASSTASSTGSSSIHSESSTIVYDHEPFEIFQSRVRQLCRRVWPMALHEQTTIERLKGGSFNRVMGLSIVELEDGDSASKTSTSYYILRVPRFDGTAVDADVSILNLASRYARVRAPQVVAFDPTPSNPLENPYMIQKRIAGQRLHVVYPSLSHEQQCVIAKQIGQFFNGLLTCTSKATGGFVPMNEDSAKYQPLSEAFPGVMASLRPLGELDVMGYGSVEDDIELVKDLKYPGDHDGLSWSDTLLAAFEHRLNIEKLKPEDDFIEVMYMESFIQATKSMEPFFRSFANQNCLCHLDIAPRNILVDLDSFTGPTITGILDWDEAVFAPSFVACAPPIWVWAWSDEEEGEDERMVNDPLPSQNQREVKVCFEEAAGPVYKNLAYLPQFRLARKLCRFSMTQTRTTETMDEIDDFFEEVAEMQKDTRFGLKVTPLNPPGLPKDVRRRSSS